MMEHMGKYEWNVDESGKKITLEAEGPDFPVPGRKAMYGDAYGFKSADQVIATSSVQAADGTWTVFATGKTTRTWKDEK